MSYEEEGDSSAVSFDVEEGLSGVSLGGLDVPLVVVVVHVVLHVALHVAVEGPVGLEDKLSKGAHERPIFS